MLSRTRLAALSLALAVLLVCAGCASGGSASPTVSETATQNPNQATQEPVTPAPTSAELTQIDLLNGDYVDVGHVTGWYGQLLAQNGIELNIVAAPADVMNAYLASGDLGDVVCFANWDQVSNAIGGGMLINLDDYSDQMPNAFSLTPYALQYVRDQHSNETGALYVLPSGSGPEVYTFSPDVFGLSIRWDIFSKLENKPKTEKLEDLIPLFLAMQKAYPETEDGLKTYAFPLFSDWDEGIRFSPANIVFSMLGYTDSTMRYFITINSVNGTIGNIFEDNGIYYRALKFLYELNQAGLMDPDSATQKWDTAMSKLGSGVYFASGWGSYTSYFDTAARKTEGVGFMLYDFDEEVVCGMGPCTVGVTKCQFGISSKTQNLDACLKFLDLRADTEFQFLKANGPEGWYWEVGQDGTAVHTQRYFDSKKSGEWKLEDGTDFKDPWIALQTTSSYLVEKYGQRIKGSAWPDNVAYNNNNKLVADWQSYYGKSTPMELLNSENKYVNRSEAYVSFMPTMPDDIAAIRSAVGDLYVTASWKIIYAKDDATFQSLWDKMVKDAEALGASQVIEWATEQVNAGTEMLNQYKASSN
jgi:putative aldouronate transport system substrate-binding protein